MSTDVMQEMAEQCLETMQAMAGMMGMGGMGSMMSMEGWLVWAILGLLLVGAVVALAVALSKRRSSGQESTATGPLDELDRRYARGEVDRDTYLQVRGDLQQARG